MAAKHSPNPDHSTAAWLSRGAANDSRPRERQAKIGRKLVVGALLALVLLTSGAAYVVERLGVAPRLLGPYLERRAQGHAAYIEAPVGWLAQQLVALDRAELTPLLEFPSWTERRFAVATAPVGREVLITTSEQLIAALAEALPGDAITLTPGVYRYDGHALNVERPGRAQAPIVVRAPARGTVTLQFNMLEGFRVAAPYWIFENLTIRGVCEPQAGCEHAFHVVGAAHHVTIRGNEIAEFNAHIKINGEGGRFPDRGVIAHNRLFNTKARLTDAPVTLIDLVAASDWTIESNLIADFVKAGGDQTSYGAFAKGGGAGNRFISNVVLCEHRWRGAPGRRVGLSFGGGGSTPDKCRDRRCIVEHEGGTMTANVIAACSDEGIYLNRAARSELVHNTVLDTAGVRIRYPESTAVARGNLIDGLLAERDGGLLVDEDNHTTSLALIFAGIHPVRDLFAEAATLDLRWTGAVPRREAIETVPDLCGAARPARPAYGAFERIDACSGKP
jgi:hypothetical protein